MPDNQDGYNEDFHSLDFDEKAEIEKLQATIRSMSNFTDDSEGFLSQSPKALMEGGALEKYAINCAINSLLSYSSIFW